MVCQSDRHQVPGVGQYPVQIIPLARQMHVESQGVLQPIALVLVPEVLPSNELVDVHQVSLGRCLVWPPILVAHIPHTQSIREIHRARLFPQRTGLWLVQRFLFIVGIILYRVEIRLRP